MPVQEYRARQIKHNQVLSVANFVPYDDHHKIESFYELKEFPRNDPWREFFGKILDSEAKNFSGKTILEGGSGNGSLTLATIFATSDHNLSGPKHIINVDINSVGHDLAWHHLKQVGYADRTELWLGSIIQFLNQRDAPIPADIGIFCLPQVPQAHKYRLKESLRRTDSDTYDPDYIYQYAKKYNDVGLSLVAETLHELHEKVSDEFTGYFIFSDRFPSHRRDEMIDEMGWEIQEIFTTPHPIQQDADTPLDAYLNIKGQEDQTHFWSKIPDGSFEPISTQEAVKKVQESNLNLNVYHHLNIVKLVKKGINGYERTGHVAHV